MSSVKTIFGLSLTMIMFLGFSPLGFAEIESTPEPESTFFIGEISWSDSHYLLNEPNIITVIDSDMNLSSTAFDSFEIDVWSDSDVGGIGIIVTETGVSNGIFQAVVYFVDELSSEDDHKIRVTEGDIVYAEYEDQTLPPPYSVADELDVMATIEFDYGIGWFFDVTNPEL